MEVRATSPAHQCTRCAKSYSRRENLVRHIRSAHDRNNTPYACSLCSSQFTRSDLLSRHQKIHQRPHVISKDGLGEGSRVSDPTQYVSEFQSTTKHPRHGTNENVVPENTTAMASTTTDPLSPTEEDAGTDSNLDADLALPTLHEHQIASADQVDVTDWGFQWPFYGEGLQDTNLDWTLDFLSNGIPTHSPFDSVHNDEGMIHATLMDHSGLGQILNSGASRTRDDDMQDGPQTWQEEEETGHGNHVNRNIACGASIFKPAVDILEAKTLQTKSQISEMTYRTMMDTVNTPLLNEFCSKNGNIPHSFPPILTIIYFLELFFVHVQPRFPVLHMATFDSSKCSPNLLLSMAILGSSYSKPSQDKFALTYLERARMSIKLMQEKDQRYLRSSENLFAFFLISVSAMWVGQKAAFERFEGDRGDLAVHCRRGQLLDCRTKGTTASQSSLGPSRTRMEDTWMCWINEEQKKRLGLCIYLLDCQMAAFFQRQPYISKAETANTALPCSNTFWKAPTAWAWKSLLGPADIPPSTYFLTTLTTILLYKSIPDVLPFPPLDDFCKTLYAYVLHTHVFEWRQTISMLNPTGLLSSPVSLAPQNIGDSLKERREWLLASLENWDTSYGNGNQADPTNRDPKNSSGILLFHLAMLALHLNFSDLHIITGRSGSDADIELAKQSLRNWLQEERVQRVFDCNTQMLTAARDAIAAGDAQRSSFELAICLFMGGLTSWAISRFGGPVQIPTLTASGEYVVGQRYDQHQSNPGSFAESSSEAKDFLTGQVSEARDGLRALKCLRLAVAFGDILDIHSEPR